MGETTGISWTDATFNPWWGCTRVSPGCEHCYAEVMAKRFGYDIWGPRAERRLFKNKPGTFENKHWAEPVNWNKQAQQAGRPITVFCGSMCDILESKVELDAWRLKLFKLIEKTPFLTWLLLTKRPENAEIMFPSDWIINGFPANVWLGVSVENQHYIHRLMQICYLQVKRFVSVEPMLGPVNFEAYWFAIDWLICGGESQPGCRPMDLDWAYTLLLECNARQIPFFTKQLGGYPDKRDRIEEWPKELQIQQFPIW